MSSLDSDKDTAKHSQNTKAALDGNGEAVVRKTEEKQQQVDGKKHDAGRSREKRGAEDIRKEEKGDERRSKREREEPAKKESRHRERRFREVKEKDSSSRPVRDRDIRERDLSKEMRERDISRGLKDRDTSREVTDRDHSSYRRPSDRWRGDDRSRSRWGSDQDQDRGYSRGRGRRHFGTAGRQSWPGRYRGNDREGNARNGWGDEDREMYPRRQSYPYQSKGDRWKHDMFESLTAGPNAAEPEEDPVAKVEALLAS